MTAAIGHAAEGGGDPTAKRKPRFFDNPTDGAPNPRGFGA